MNLSFRVPQHLLGKVVGSYIGIQEKPRTFTFTTTPVCPLLTIDVAHPPRTSDLVEEDLLQAWTTVRNSSTLRIIKVVHGYGSTGKGGTTRETVRNWAFRQRRHFHAVIAGEHYDLFNTAVQAMRMEVGQYADMDLRQANPGVTIIWVK